MTTTVSSCWYEVANLLTNLSESLCLCRPQALELDRRQLDSTTEKLRSLAALRQDRRRSLPGSLCLHTALPATGLGQRWLGKRT